MLDADTGTALPTNGDPQPLLDQRFRPLQPVAGYPDFFWAAVSEGEGEATVIGIFHSKTLTFRELVRLPKVSFDSMSLWVDEPAAKFYFAYGGHLLSLPLPKTK